MKTLVLAIGVTFFSLTSSAAVNSNNVMENEGDRHFHTYASLALMAPAWEAMHLTEAATKISAEESLEVESWMTNENMFAFPLPVAEPEESLEVESWMLSGENFVDTPDTLEKEKALEVEPWMLDQNRWGNEYPLTGSN